MSHNLETRENSIPDLDENKAMEGIMEYKNISPEESEDNFKKSIEESVATAAIHSEAEHSPKLDIEIMERIQTLKNEGKKIIEIASVLKKEFDTDLEYTTPLINAATIKKHWEEKEKGEGLSQKSDRTLAELAETELKKGISGKQKRAF